MSEALGIIALAKAKALLSEIEIQAQINDRIYEGVDLTVKFATEIAASPYNGDPWAWIKARIQAENFTGIHVGDWIPFTTTNNYTFNAQIAGINTYKGYGDSEIGNHIDFISVELLNTRHPINNVNYNNGVAAAESPWKASDLYLYLNALAGTVPSAAEAGGGEGTAVDYTASGVYYYLPTNLKNVIVNKRFTAPRRYSANGLLTDDNQWLWFDIGNLWLPDEFEIFGSTIRGTNAAYTKGGAVQYPLFEGRATNRVKKRGGTRTSWWILLAAGGSSQSWCTVTNNGRAQISDASSNTVSAPICFRVT